MLMMRLQPKYAKHLMGFLQIDIGALIEALYGIEEDISKGLWSASSLSDSKGKKPHRGQRYGDVGTIRVLLGRDHSGDSKLLHKLLEHLTLHFMYNKGHLLLLDLWR